jgi:hypothetical protein
LVHNVGCGPFKTTTYNVVLYFVTFIDDYSRQILVTFMKTKNQVLKEFKIFKGVIETIIGHKLESL